MDELKLNDAVIVVSRDNDKFLGTIVKFDKTEFIDVFVSEIFLKNEWKSLKNPEVKKFHPFGVQALTKTDKQSIREHFIKKEEEANLRDSIVYINSIAWNTIFDPNFNKVNDLFDGIQEVYHNLRIEIRELSRLEKEPRTSSNNKKIQKQYTILNMLDKNNTYYLSHLHSIFTIVLMTYTKSFEEDNKITIGKKNNTFINSLNEIKDTLEKKDAETLLFFNRFRNVFIHSLGNQCLVNLKWYEINEAKELFFNLDQLLIKLIKNNSLKIMETFLLFYPTADDINEIKMPNLSMSKYVFHAAIKKQIKEMKEQKDEG